MHSPRLLALSLCAIVVGNRASADAPEVKNVARVPAEGTPHYVGNRAPLAPSPLVKLPIGAIVPRGWLRAMLETEARGMVGNLPELSRWCRFENNAWTDPQGKGHSGWEEMPYWLKGYGDLGYVLKDEKIIAETRRWIEAILKTQEKDGWFGPRGLRTSLDGKPDLWPHMLVLNILQSHYEVTGDKRVLDFMAKYFEWEMNCPEKDFLTGYWPKIRAGDNLESVIWLYNRTGDKKLLPLMEKIHKHTARWDTGVINWHGVNITQGFREPGVYFLAAKDPRLLEAVERNYQTVMGLYGQVPGGMFGADENARPGYIDPRQGAETCSMVEFMHSFQMLTKITGDSIWSDRCEEVAFNSLPAALTPDQKALHYLTGANMVQLDRHNKAPGLQNGGTMLSYSPLEVYRCCQHNVAHGWPYFAEELWLATADRGLCASMYAPSEVTAKVGADGDEVTIVTDTDYPFSDTITFRIKAAKPVQFPLYLRVPHWCSDERVSVNGTRVEPDPREKAFLLRTSKKVSKWYLVLNSTWKSGDVVELRLPMKVSLRTW
ncbi:MAG: beta-L-arabinofuranosidase domain-containing protein, partial [Pirellulales bacterium]